MGEKLSKIPFDLEYNDNICSKCNGNIEFKKRTDHIGINWQESCGGCIRCLRKKGCGGYEKIEEKEVDIPICNNCNICPMCKESVFNINDQYQEDALCKKNDYYFHVNCYRKFTKPNNSKRHYEWNGMNSKCNKWEFKGIYRKCNKCSEKYIIPIDKSVTKDEARKKIVDIYRMYNPQKIRKVDDLLNKYIGRESELSELIALVDNKYAVKYPNTCPECISNIEFKIEWKTLTPEQKLIKYGVIKLRILAKKKKLEGYSTWKKSELVKNLKPLVTHKDFPIR